MSKIRMGIIGCGAIAQVQHMPNLAILHALYEVTWVCDISPGLAKWLAEVFHVPNHTTERKSWHCWASGVYEGLRPGF